MKLKFLEAVNTLRAVNIQYQKRITLDIDETSFNSILIIEGKDT